MITTAILQIFYFFLVAILSPLSLFNDVTISSSVTDSLNYAQTWFSTLNAFIPVDILLVILGLVFTIETGVIVYKLIMWLKRLIPTMGG